MGTVEEELRKIYSQEEVADAIEHRDALLNIRSVLTTKAGLDFIEYLFKNFEVGVLPDMGLEGNLLHERLGILRTGNAIFKLIAEANADVAGALLAKIEKDRYAKLYAKTQIGAE